MKNLKNFAELIRPELKFDDRYERVASILGMNELERSNTVPKKNVEKQLIILSEFFESLTIQDKDYYDSFCRIQEFLNSLIIPKFNNDKLQKLSEIVKNCIVLNRNGFSEKTFYSTTKSATGRLTVIGGPNVLTMPAEFKSAIDSSFPKGRIVQIDVISAEPKIAWLEAGNDPVRDVYKCLADDFDNLMDRSTAKKVVLCALYGQSMTKLQDQLPSSLSAKDVVAKTRKKLGYDSLLEKIRSNNENVVRNGFGRPLRIGKNDSGPLLMSHYLQSTAAEASLLAFDDFTARFTESCRPIYVIHDALVADCDESLVNKLIEMKTLKLKGSKYVLHASVELC